MLNKAAFTSLTLNFRKMDVKRFCRHMEMKKEEAETSLLVKMTLDKYMQCFLIKMVGKIILIGEMPYMAIEEKNNSEAEQNS